MDVGATLRHARQGKRLTLDQLSRTTKISRSNLQALENNDFDRLPATVYTRGFLRAIARELGLDPEDTVEQYIEQVEEERRLLEPQPSLVPPAPVSHLPPQHDNAPAGAIPLHIQIDLKGLPRPAIAAGAFVLLVALIAIFVSRGGDDTETSTVEAAQPAATPASSQASADAARAANVVDDVLRFELKTTGLCWVSASADRAPLFARLLQAGESETIEAKDEVVIRVGDPSTVSLTINGAPLRPLGRAGIPVTVQINRQNYREYLVG